MKNRNTVLYTVQDYSYGDKISHHQVHIHVQDWSRKRDK